ncbi:hypothetical protein, partial [Actinomadura sp. HBU206391]|uniref:hypothetical protein n=1 Tax=Actinomadura sp. HBU206391 TaxID=2731692 RepID=UPI001C9D130A
AYRLALRLTRHTARAAFMTTAAVAASVPFWSGRPLVFGILAMLVLLWIVEVPDSRVGAYPLVSICGVMWLWANLHGTFALGFLYLALHIAGQWLDGHPPIRGREKRLSIATLVAFGLCFVNPYGLDIIIFPVQMLSRGNILSYVIEWSSPDFHNVIGILFAIWIASFLGVLLLASRRPSRRDVLVFLAFVLLALWAQRNVALTPLVGLPIIARISAIDELRDRGRALNYLLIPLIIFIGVQNTVSQLNKPDFDLRRYPVQAMQALEQRGMLGRRIATTDDWSGYIIHAYWPRQEVFIDDRYDMYPAAVVHDYFKLLGADLSWSETLNRHRIDIVLWPRGASLSAVLTEAAAWQQIYQDDKATVFIRK